MMSLNGVPSSKDKINHYGPWSGLRSLRSFIKMVWLVVAEGIWNMRNKWSSLRLGLFPFYYLLGRPNSVRPGKPIMYTVFDRLVADTVFKASMEIESQQFLKSSTEESLAKLQDTVIQLSRVYNGKPPKEFDTRIRYLLSKIGKMQKDIETYEKSIADNKKLLVTSWEDASYWRKG